MLTATGVCEAEARPGLAAAGRVMRPGPRFRARVTTLLAGMLGVGGETGVWRRAGRVEILNPEGADWDWGSIELMAAAEEG